MSHFASLFSYPEPLPPIWRGNDRIDRLSSERSVNQVAYGPYPLDNAKRHGWCGPQALMDAVTQWK